LYPFVLSFGGNRASQTFGTGLRSSVVKAALICFSLFASSFASAGESVSCDGKAYQVSMQDGHRFIEVDNQKRYLTPTPSQNNNEWFAYLVADSSAAPLVCTSL
jgi:hypothetical protein